VLHGVSKQARKGEVWIITIVKPFKYNCKSQNNPAVVGVEVLTEVFLRIHTSLIRRRACG
jgi:hypothetical protein